MMPKDKKREASVLLKAFLNGENLPENPNWFPLKWLCRQDLAVFSLNIE